MPSAWVQHVQKTYQAGKAKGMSYKQAMQAAKKTWASKKAGTSKKKEEHKEEKVEDCLLYTSPSPRDS